MGIMKETDKRFINLERKLGIFAVVALSGLILLVVLVGYQRDLFASKTRLYLIADSGRDITEGMPVKLSGFKIGKVKHLYLDEIAMVKVELSINSHFMQWIRSDSVARVVKEGVIGDAIVEITPGSARGVPLATEDLLSFERGRGLNEMAEEVAGEVKRLMIEIEEVVHYINDPQGDLKQILANVNRLTGDLSASRARLDTLLDNTDRRLGGTFKEADTLLKTTTAAVEGLTPLIESAGTSLEAVETTLPQLLERVDNSLQNVETMTGDLKKAVEAGAPALPRAIAEGERVIGDAGEVVDALKQTWPISSNVAPPKEEILKGDSYR